MYFQPTTKRIFNNHNEIRATLINVLFPSIIDDEILAYSGVFPVAYDWPQVADDETAEPVSVEKVDGIWTQMWHIRPATQKELDTRAAALAPEISPQVSRRQVRQALLLTGLLDQVSTKIALIEDVTKRGMTQIEWEDSEVFERNRPLLIEIGAAIGLDADGLDALFIEAAKL